MKRKLVIFSSIILIMISVMPAFAATVLKSKEEAELLKKDNVYAEVGVEEIVVNKDQVDDRGMRMNDDALNKFTAVTATKNGNTYTNNWSNYKITIGDQFINANDTYDFNADGIKYDFGIVFNDYSRLAVYYSRLSRDLNIVAANFAPKAVPDDVEIAGTIYKHVALDVPFPYGVERYNYYLRDIDGKLMVIETFHEDKYNISRKYIDLFEPVK